MGKKKREEKKREELQYYFTEKKTSLVAGIISAFLILGLGLAIVFFQTPQISVQRNTIKITTDISPQPTKPATKTIDYVLQENESLWDVAQRYYNDPLLYTKIARDNNFSNPDVVAPGTKLKLYNVLN